MMIHTLSTSQLWHLAGWTMIHYLWIGSLIGVAAYLLRLPIRRRTPALRYALTLACFFAMATAPVGIATWLASDAQFAASYAFSSTTEEVLPHEALRINTANTQAMGEDNERAEPTSIDLAKNPIVLSAQSSGKPVAQPESDPVSLTSSPGEISRETPRPTAAFDFHSLLASITAIAPWIWIVGAPLTFLLLASGLIGAKRLRRTARVLNSGIVYDLTQRLRQAAGVSRQVTVAVSDRVLQPVLVGIVRPLILLPPAAINGWSPAQLEMALLHELTHVRRWDNFVNLVQRVVESLLFFQPAVWMVSRWLRADREQCCDAAVVRHTGEPAAYAELLVSVAQNSLNPRLPSTAVAMARHPLSARIRRILQLEDDPMLVSKSTFGVTGVLLAAVVGILLWQPAPDTVAQESAEEVIELKEDSASRGVPAPGKGAPDDAVPEAAAIDLTTEGTEEAVEAKPASRGLPASGSVPPNSPFLPLDQQRIADLVYKMLKVEITPLDKNLLPAVKEKRFAGGVMIESSLDPTAGALKPGDIVVGLHVWPTANFDQLAEVLRRDDLMEFSPLKYYLLRPIPPQQQPARGGGRGGMGRGMGMEGRGGGEMSVEAELGRRLGGGEMSGEFGGGFGRGRGEFGGMNGGGEEFGDGGGFGGDSFGGGRGGFSGRGGESGQGGGFGGRATTEEQPAEAETPQYQLITGRISIPQDQWRDEQARLERVAQTTSPQAPLAPGRINEGRESLLDPAAGELNKRKAATAARQKELERQSSQALRERQWESISQSKTLLYDGRTFDDWSSQWKYELKTERRIEAIKALAAFGRAGDGERAAKAILDVAGKYEFETEASDYKTEPELQSTIVTVLTHKRDSKISPEIWLPQLIERSQEQPERYLDLLTRCVAVTHFRNTEVLDMVLELADHDNPQLREKVVYAILKTDVEPLPERATNVYRRLLSDSDPSVRVAALGQMPKMAQALFSSGEGQPLEVPPEFPSNLLHPDPRVRQQARMAFASFGRALKSKPELGTQILEVLAKALDNPASVRPGNPQELVAIQLAALRALRMVPPDQLPMESLEKGLMKLMQGDSPNLAVAASVTSGYWKHPPGYVWNVDDSRQELAALRADDRPVDEVAKEFKEQWMWEFSNYPGYRPDGGGFGGRRGGFGE